MLVKIDFELDFSALFDLVRKSKISIAITITFPDTHSIVTFRVSNWFFLSFYQHLSNLHAPAVEDQPETHPRTVSVWQPNREIRSLSKTCISDHILTFKTKLYLKIWFLYLFCINIICEHFSSFPPKSLKSVWNWAHSISERWKLVAIRYATLPSSNLTYKGYKVLVGFTLEIFTHTFWPSHTVITKNFDKTGLIIVILIFTEIWLF